jgi:hypothetical protein
MDQLRGKNSVLFIAVIVVAAFIWYFITGGPGSKKDDDSKVKKPWNAVEMTVSSVQSDGSFRGRIERAGRHAEKGFSKIGTYDRVNLRLADVEPPQPVRDECWVEEGQKALTKLMGARIWVDPDDIERQGSGTFTVYAWNRSDAFVQEKLLRDGDGKVFAGRLSAQYADALTAAEDEASAAQRGLWKTCGDT